MFWGGGGGGGRRGEVNQRLLCTATHSLKYARNFLHLDSGPTMVVSHYLMSSSLLQRGIVDLAEQN